MIENHDFPWYLQQSPTFSSLYYGFFPAAVAASPLGIGDAFDIDAMTGVMLVRLGRLWGIYGTPSVNNGLIYDIDDWSLIKLWDGDEGEAKETLYRNLIKAKMFANGRPYSIETLYGTFERALEGLEYQIDIVEQYMSVTIRLTASADVIRDFIEMRTFDVAFIGKPAGISVEWEYVTQE